MAKTPLKTYSLDEMEDKFIGKKGTPARNEYENKLRMDVLGYTIKKARLERKLTQDQLGRLVGVKKSQISKLENSANSASISTIGKVFTALDADVYFTIKFRNKAARLAGKAAGK